MTARATVRVDLSALEELHDKWDDALGWVQGNRAEAQRFAFKNAEELTGEVREKILDSAQGRALPGQRTGALARSFREEWGISRTGNMRIGTFSRLVYAGVQDHGGRIHAKRQFLAIPLTAKSVTKWPRDWPRGELFFIRSRRGNALLAMRNGRGIRPMYALKRSVYIQPKHYTRDAIRAFMPGFVKRLTRAIAGELT